MTARLQVPMTIYKSHVGGQCEALAAVCEKKGIDILVLPNVYSNYQPTTKGHK